MVIHSSDTVAGMKWLQVSVDTDAEVAEAVADALTRFAPGGVAIELSDGDAKPGQGVTIKAFLPIGPDTPRIKQQLEEALWHLGQISPIAAPTFSTVLEADWADAWKTHFHPLRIGQRIVIKPTWRQFDAAPDDILIELDPGMAFGTGLHPTTQMCLQALEDVLRPGMHVLDLGTGSGILALAAAKLGAEAVLALDTDPVAVAAARENIRRNGVSERVTAFQGSLDRAPGVYDLVVVNILAKVIVALVETGLAERVRPGGKWVVAGIIENQETEVVSALTAAGLLVAGRRQFGDWVTLMGRKPPTI